MQVVDAQKDVRYAFLGGFMGQIVSGLLWMSSAALATWNTPKTAIIVLVVGGAFIFPITQLGLRLMGRSGKLAAESPMRGLAMQIAFTIPLTLPVVGAATLYKLNWLPPPLILRRHSRG